MGRGNNSINNSDANLYSDETVTFVPRNVADLERFLNATTENSKLKELNLFKNCADELSRHYNKVAEKDDFISKLMDTILNKYKHLESLNMAYCRDIVRLGSSRNIKHLNLAGCKMLSMVNARISEMFPQLQSLNLSCINAMGVNLDLSDMENIQALNLSGLSIYIPQGIIVRLNKLRELDLSNTDTNFYTVNGFLTSKNMRKLNLQGCRDFTEDNIKHLHNTYPELVIIDPKGKKVESIVNINNQKGWRKDTPPRPSEPITSDKWKVGFMERLKTNRYHMPTNTYFIP